MMTNPHYRKVPTPTQDMMLSAANIFSRPRFMYEYPFIIFFLTLQAYNLLFSKHMDYHSRFQSFYQRMETTCGNEKPLFLANPSESVIEIVTYGQYVHMTSTEFKSLLRKKNVVITGHPVPKIDFDEEGLQTLTSMHLPVSLQGLCILCLLMMYFVPYLS